MRISSGIGVYLLCGLLVATSAAEELPQRLSHDQEQVDRAVTKAVDYLKTYAATVKGHRRDRDPWVDPAWVDELVLLTFIHAGVPETDPEFQRLLRVMFDRPFTTAQKRRLVYSVAFQAMILEELDRVAFQDRIQQCAQWLVDNQCENGQWDPWGATSDTAEQMGRGLTSKLTDFSPLQDAPPIIQRAKPKVVRTVRVKKVLPGGIGGDNGASAFAALGLRACHDAGVEIPAEVLNRAETWWRDSQANHKQETASGLGWCYCEQRNPKAECGPAYGSATAGGVSALVIYDHLLGRDLKRDVQLQRGVAWLASQHRLMQDQVWYYSYLYQLSNAGDLLGVEKFGEQTWYPAGVRMLLATQRDDGAWPQKDPPHEWLRLSDTCFAVLFLKRSARPLVAQHGAR